MNGNVKDALLHCKRCPFTHQKVLFYIVKGHLSLCKRAPIGFQIMNNPYIVCCQQNF